ncbi:lipocalin-like domain-containing protein [Nonlabens ponticola]|uniref:Lipocalin-like domain-containing protein n=1 Tax=Nonlabens ponticola TaxID=2496866 RepID=A0A3S9MXT0_9FLAO|nr:lipocalin family protein [Nonlabens ponticola]AZQ44051.1 hypothetical protein EJ995_07325 [Nonlabens ponticola]
MKIVFGLLSFLLLASCSQNNHVEKLKHLEGYWTIDTVVKDDGEVKEFPFTNHMDFFEVNGSQGTKSRVSPTYDGTFIVYGDPVKFSWSAMDDALILQFKDGEQSYKQTVEKATEETLQLVHTDGTIYNYTSHKPDYEE